MTREEFIKMLDKEDYSYEIQGNKIVFNNEGYVFLSSLTSLPSGVVFNNKTDVCLNRLTSLPPDVEFNNGRDVELTSLVGGWFHDWEGNIEGINNKRLLNLMISKGLFER
jgi:hypothetical protein